MDLGSVTPSGRCKNKPLKRQKPNGGGDIISNLPVPIIGHILSSLPTKDAVRTCVLSKRWIYLWTFITKLHFDDSVHYSSKKITSYKRFADFVYRVLLHLNASSIESFSLVLSKKYDPSLVNTWISTILNRGVKTLHVDSKAKLALSFHSFFKCRSLVELVLNVDCCIVRVSSNVSLPYLTLLDLSGVTFTDSRSNMEELCLSFPVLKKFQTYNCTWLSVKGFKFNFEVPLLEIVSIELNMCDPDFDTHNCVIKFSASRLTEFTYCGNMLRDTILLDPSSAYNATANIILDGCEILPETLLHAHNLLIQFNQVKCLKFGKKTEILAHAKNFVADVPAFGMLTHLELGLVTGENLFGFLLRSPLLKTLVFQGLTSFDKDLLESGIVPDCLLSTLQVVKFGSFNGYEHEQCLAKFVMENAVVMERMSFSIGSVLRRSVRVLEEVKEKLFSCKKGFSLAIIEFSCV